MSLEDELIAYSKKHFDIKYWKPLGSTETYLSFGPEWYVDNGTIDEVLLRDLQGGATMLSVGVGKAYLERAITSLPSIGRDQIVLADSEPTTPRIEGFSYWFFDMNETWPEGLGAFDYVVFPESLSVATMYTGKEETHRFRDDLERDANRVLHGDPPIDQNLFTSVIEADCGNTMTTYNVLREAAGHVDVPGDIRVSGGVASGQQEAYIRHKFTTTTKGRVGFRRCKDMFSIRFFGDS